MPTTTTTRSVSDPVADQNRRALKRATADPAAAVAAMLTPAALRAFYAAASAYDAKGARDKADRLRGVPRSLQMAEDGIALHAGGSGNGGMPAATAAAKRLELLRGAHAVRAGGGLTALAVGMAAGCPPIPTEPYRPTVRSSLPRLHRVTAADARRLVAVPDTLPGFMGGDRAAADLQAALPGFEAPTAAGGCPSWILWLFDRAGGQTMKPGRGAPWEMRLFVAVLLHMPISDRDGQWRSLQFPVSEVEDWLHPRGWANRRRDWHRLPEALARMRDLAYVPVPGIGSVMMLAPSVIPATPADPVVEFVCRIPAAASKGARLDWPTLCRYGVDSAPQYRAYLAVAAAMDWTAYHGAPITRLIGAPVVDSKSGRPRRSRGGRLRRRADVLVPHPNAAMVPRWSDATAARFIGLDPTKRCDRMRARQALERIADDGVFDLQRTARGMFELYGKPRPGRDS